MSYYITTFYIVLIIINIAVVTVVYYYNRHPIGTLDKSTEISPQKLCRILYEAYRKPPDAFTYNQLVDGRYVIYRYDEFNSKYVRSVEAYPVDINGEQWKPQEDKVEVKFTKAGFKVAGIPNELTCPHRWYWNVEKGKCMENPLCPNGYDNSLLPLLNAYYTEINNPAITMHTKLTDQIIHPRLYIQCSKDEQKPAVNECSENTFVQLSEQKVDKSQISNIPSLEDGQPNVDALCKIFDVCKERAEGSMHVFPFSDGSTKSLEHNEYFVCKEGKSIRKKCPVNYKLNPDAEHGLNHLCIPMNHCDNSSDFYFWINNYTYGLCQSHIEHIVSCRETGIINFPDGSIECRNAECLEENQIVHYSNYWFDYPYGVKSCFETNSRKLVSCDEMFEKLNPHSKIHNISLPREKITRSSDLEYKTVKKFYEDQEIVLPTKFYYDKDQDECVVFKGDVLETLRTKGMIQENAVIHKSSSFGMRSLPFRLRDDVMLLNPAHFGIKNANKIYAIYREKIYSTVSSKDNEGKEWGDSSKYYSFITPIIKEPKLLDNDNILEKIYDNVDGVYYALCIKYHQNLNLYIDEKMTSVRRISLTQFIDQTTGAPISSTLTDEYEIDFDDPKLKFQLPNKFPFDDFTWNKVFVGKYFYDTVQGNLIIWHDHMFIINIKKGTLIIEEEVDDKGQFVPMKNPFNVVSMVYKNDRADIQSKKFNETALVTTFNCFGHYFDKPAPFWLSFINAPYNELMNDEKILNYFTIVYPNIQSEKAMCNLLKSIFALEPLTMKFKHIVPSFNLVKE